MASGASRQGGSGGKCLHFGLGGGEIFTVWRGDLLPRGRAGRFGKKNFDSIRFVGVFDSIRFDSTSQKALTNFFFETSCEASNVAETVVVYIDI